MRKSTYLNFCIQIILTRAGQYSILLSRIVTKISKKNMYVGIGEYAQLLQIYFCHVYQAYELVINCKVFR